MLDDISLSLSSGHIYGIKGKNGSGKTMLMRAIAGLIRLSDGSVVWDGKVLHKDISSPESIGVLIEYPAFLPGYTGRKNLELLASLKGGTPFHVNRYMTHYLPLFSIPMTDAPIEIIR